MYLRPDRPLCAFSAAMRFALVRRKRSAHPCDQKPGYVQILFSRIQNTSTACHCFQKAGHEFAAQLCNWTQLCGLRRQVQVVHCAKNFQFPIHSAEVSREHPQVKVLGRRPNSETAIHELGCVDCSRTI
mmetsp:Transcript_60140/g.110480  ORF Transcript_60140/g.110480 Transcript_60140/m.110480 type:complete len:129 (+) Transcript_60140:17-403(+)